MKGIIDRLSKLDIMWDAGIDYTMCVFGAAFEGPGFTLLFGPFYLEVEWS